MAFVNSTVKPPREVRRRQEKFGTGGAAVPEKIKYVFYEGFHFIFFLRGGGTGTSCGEKKCGKLCLSCLSASILGGGATLCVIKLWLVLDTYVPSLGISYASSSVLIQQLSSLL